MNREYTRRSAPERHTDNRTERPRTIAPGKVTRTSKLDRNRSGAVQRKATAPPDTRPVRAPRTAWDQTMDSWMDMAHRGLAALQQAGPDQGPATGEARTVQASGAGEPMPAEVQAKMERAFGADFSAVRIHEGAQAASLGALAYTRGTEIHFAPGQYDPDSPQGQQLLGHELTHVVQQSQGRVEGTKQAKGVALNDDPSLEREADEMGAKAARGESVSGTSGTQSIGASGDGPVQCHLTIGGETIDNPLLTKIGLQVEIKARLATLEAEGGELDQIFGAVQPNENIEFSNEIETRVYELVEDNLPGREYCTPHWVWQIWSMVKDSPAESQAKDPRVRTLVQSDLKWQFDSWDSMTQKLTEGEWDEEMAHSIPEALLDLSASSNIAAVQWPPSKITAKLMHGACGAVAETLLARAQDAGGQLKLKTVNLYIGGDKAADLEAFLTQQGPHALYDITIKNLHELTIEKTANSDDAVLVQGWLGSYEGLWWSGDVTSNDELDGLRAQDDLSPVLARRLETLERIAADRDRFGKGQVVDIGFLANTIAAFLALDTFGHRDFLDTCKQIPGFDDGNVKDKHRRNAAKDVQEQEKIEIMVKRYEVTNPDDARNGLKGANGDYITSLVMSDLAQHV